MALSLHDVETRRILAERVLRTFFDWFGVASVHLPAITVVVVLLGWHVARQRDPVRPQWRTMLGMLAESLVLVAPLFVMQLLTQRAMHGPEPGGVVEAATAAGGEAWRWLLAAAGPEGGGASDWASGLLLSIGAGVYEELVFRLMGIALLAVVFEDVLALPRGWSAVLAATGSSLAFAWYHFWGTGEPIDPTRFTFYTLAGLYFAGIYVLRGFGVVVAVHAFYDVLIVSAPRLAAWTHGSG